MRTPTSAKTVFPSATRFAHATKETTGPRQAHAATRAHNNCLTAKAGRVETQCAKPYKHDSLLTRLLTAGPGFDQRSAALHSNNECSAIAIIDARHAYPSPIMGFDTVAQFMDFGDALQSEFAAVGIDDADFYMQGSAVTNQRFDDGTTFSLEESDFDVLVVSDQLAERAREAGLEFRSSGLSQPIDDDGPAEIAGIRDARTILTSAARRDVNFMVVSSADVQGLEQLGVYLPSRTG